METNSLRWFLAGEAYYHWIVEEHEPNKSAGSRALDVEEGEVFWRQWV